MTVPIRQTVAVLSHVWKNRLARNSRYPLVLMLEPLLRCNLACAGCGKIQHPPEVLKRHLSVDQCLDAAEQCGAPIVSIPGGEPLLHPDIDSIVSGLVRLKRFVYLCTNAIKLEESLVKFQPSAYLAFSVHVDGPRELHDRAVCRAGIFDKAISAIRAARSAGFRVTTNTTIFSHTRAEDLTELFDTLSELGVEGMMVSPGFAYEKAPDQQHFMNNGQATNLLDEVMQHPHAKRWRFNQSPLYLQFLRGRWSMDCTPWGSPTYNLFGWQRPCYLIDEGYVASYGELINATDWSAYGHHSGNDKCGQCMTHCGFEPTAVAQTLSSWRGLSATIQAMARPNSLRPVTDSFALPLKQLSTAVPQTDVRSGERRDSCRQDCAQTSGPLVSIQPPIEGIRCGTGLRPVLLLSKSKASQVEPRANAFNVGHCSEGKPSSCGTGVGAAHDEA